MHTDNEPQFAAEDIEAAREVAEDFHSRFFMREKMPDMIPAVVFAAEVVRASGAEMRADVLGDECKTSDDRVNRALELAQASREAEARSQKRVETVGENALRIGEIYERMRSDRDLARDLLVRVREEGGTDALKLDMVDVLLRGTATDDLRATAREWVA